MSEHLSLEIAAAVHRGRPLSPGEPVPGCICTLCVPEGVSRPKPLPRLLQPLPVERAREVSILDVAARLALGEPVRRGREVGVRCPLHADEDPSLLLDPSRGIWYCFPCGEGGDGIRLVERARGVEFADAVRWLVAA